MDDGLSGGVAIVGMAAAFPGAPDLAAYARAVRAGEHAIAEAPASRLDPTYFDPPSPAAERFYVRRGGFLPDGLVVDAAALGMMPVAARGAEPDQLLALHLASRALADAGDEVRTAAEVRERTAVIIGRGGYMGPAMARLDQRVRTAEQLSRVLRDLVPELGRSRLDAVRSALNEALGPYGPDTAIGLVPNLAASRIAARFDFRGPAYTVDAACASALVAVDHACRELASHRCDRAIAGGLHVGHDPTFWSVFCRLGALSPSGAIRPFDRRADGLLIGEGAGLVVLKRLDDAERDGDRIYAVIRGVGVASDGRGSSPMAPRVEGQLLALERAWREAALDRAGVGLVEGHGTATPAGDAAELSTLARFFGPAAPGTERAALGSVKALIGHAMPAAGAAGLIKAALAIHEGFLPPSPHAEDPHPLLAATRFRLLAREEPWAAPHEARCAAVNAFGFGGIDAHVVLTGQAPRAARRASVQVPSELPTAVTAVATASGDPREAADPGDAGSLLAVSASSPADLLARLDALSTNESALAAPLRCGLATIGEGPCRLALLDPTAGRVARARAVVARGSPWRGRAGIWFVPRGLADDGGWLALVFPGVDAAFEPRVHDVAAHFGWPAPEEPSGSAIERLGLAAFAVNRIAHAALVAMGVAPCAMAGHSIGEWSAMIASGMIPQDEVDPLLASLRPGTLEVPGVAFAAVGCGVERAAAAIRDLAEIAISHDNCPHQVILCGRDDAVDKAIDRLVHEGVLAQKLPFRSGFHSPLFQPFLGPHRERFASLPLRAPDVPVWSATTCAPYPDVPAEIRALAVRHLVRPVRFRELTMALYEAGARAFVQCGAGSLAGFVGDTLRGLPHLAIAANVPRRSGMAQLRHVAAALLAEGFRVRPEAVFGSQAHRGDRPAPGSRSGSLPSESASGPVSAALVELRLGAPLVDLRLAPLALAPIESAPRPHDDSSRLLPEGDRDGDTEGTERGGRRAPPPPIVASAPFVASAPTRRSSARESDGMGAGAVRDGLDAQVVSAFAPGAEDDPVAAAFHDSLRAIAAAQRDVARALAIARSAATTAVRSERDVARAIARSSATTATTAAPVRVITAAPRTSGARVIRRTLSLETCPYLADHAFYRQPEGWPVAADRYPVVPMTMILELLVDAARSLAPELVAVAIEDVRAYRWLAVAPPVEIEIAARLDERGAVAVKLALAPPGRPGAANPVATDTYAEGIVRLAAGYPPAPEPDRTPLADERPAPISAARLYDDRYMFHGPRYRGVVELGPMGSDGIRGTLRALDAPGGLLDNAGQLFGYWMMETARVDRLAMPFAIDRVAFFGQSPAPPVRVACTVRVRELAETTVRADIELVREHEGRPFCRIEGWQDRRFESDDRVWAALRFPERYPIALPLENGSLWLLRAPFRTAASRDLLARRYLGERERAAYDAAGPRRQADWLLGRMAAKDAARGWLWERGLAEALFPIEVAVENAPSGRPLVRGPWRADLRLSIAHKQGLAVARVAEGRDVGVDVERIEERGADFEQAAFGDAERRLLPASNRPAWIARFWAAKEAVAKQRGTGLGGAPSRVPIVGVDGDRVVVDGTVVETRALDDLALAWT